MLDTKPIKEAAHSTSNGANIKMATAIANTLNAMQAILEAHMLMHADLPKKVKEAKKKDDRKTKKISE